MRPLFYKLLFIIQLFLISNISLGQKVDLGLKAGSNLTRIEIDGLSKDFFDPKLGYYAGFFSMLDLSKKFALRTELFYSQKGAKSFVNFRDASNNQMERVDIFYDYNYLELPIAFQWLPFRKNKFYFLLGPEINFLLRERVKTSKPILDFDSDTDNTKGFDIGATASVGYWINNFNIEFRYIRGLTDINTFEDSAGNNSKVTNNYQFQMGVGYNLFKLQCQAMDILEVEHL